MKRLLGFALLLLAFASQAPAATLRVGSMALQPCPREPAFCGTLARPLDPSGRVPGTIAIAFLFYPHTGPGAATGTIVTQEGGPGLPSIGSRAAYLALYRPLRVNHDMLLVDPRGTGASGVIDCRPLQTQKIMTVPAVGACGRSLGRASVLYGTPLAVDDIVAVLDKLGVGQIDYYGDSYGTFFGQVLAARYPDRLRSLVLDGAYQAVDASPWYPPAGMTVRRGFNLACKRSPYCAALAGSSLSRIKGLLATVRQQPISGTGPDGDGNLRHGVADPSSVGLILYGGASGWINYRDLDASIRALQTGDKAPLLRLVTENNASENPEAAPGYSRGLFVAVSCLDYPQIYDMNAPIAERIQQRRASLAAQLQTNPGVYAPLTLAEFQTVAIDVSVLNMCLRWPVSDPPYAPGIPIPAGARFTDAPTLVINGELDMLTPAAEGAAAAKEFSHGRHLVIANSFHVDALGDVDDCTQNIVRHFTKTLKTGDVSCAANVKPVRLVPFFPRRAADAVPPVPAAGNAASTVERSMASAALQTAADAMSRWYINYSGHDLGLRGGTWQYTQAGEVATFTLQQTRWADDLAVSGTLAWDQHSGAVTAALQFTADDGTTGSVNASYNDHESLVAAQLSGTVNGDALSATMPAP